MANPTCTNLSDGTHRFAFADSGNAIEVYPLPGGDAYVTLWQSGGSPLTARLDLADPLARLSLTAPLNGHGAVVDQELATVASLVAVGDAPNDGAEANPWDAGWPPADRGAEARRLQAENAQLRADLDRVRRVHSAAMAALANPDLKSEAWTLVRAVVIAEAAWASTPEAERPADGFVRVGIAAVTHARPGAPSRSDDVASKHLQRGHTWGLIEREIRPGSRAVETVDPTTGEIVVAHQVIKEQHIRATGDVVAALERLATFRRPEPSNHGGVRVACPRCGSAQVDLLVRCRGCGPIAMRAGSQPEADMPASLPVPASCGIDETAPGGERELGIAALGPRLALNEKAACCGYGDAESDTPLDGWDDAVLPPLFPLPRSTDEADRWTR